MAQKVRPVSIKGQDEKAVVSEEQIILQENHDLQRIPLREAALTKEQRVSRRLVTASDLTVQYVGRRFANTLPQIRSLPAWNDDTTQRFGVGIYDRMKKDAEVNASIDVLTLASTSQPIRFLPSVGNDDPNYTEAKYVSDFFQWMFDGYCQSDLNEVRTAMVDQALTYGSSTTEMTLSVIPSGRYRNMIGVNVLKPNCIEEVNFLVDNFNNVVGLVPRFSGFNASFFADSGVLPISSLDDPKKREKLLKRVVPRKKFIAMTWRSQCGDPRGQSALRAAYTFWWVKQEIINNMISWLEKYSQPSIVGIVSPNAQVTCEIDADGNPIPGTEVQPAEALLEQLVKFSSSSALALPHGTSVDMLRVADSGRIFIDMIQMANKEISRAIHKQHLATSEGLFQSRAAADVHQDILSLMIILIKNWQIRRLNRDMVRTITLMNFGPDSSHLIPIIDVGDSDGFPLDPFQVSQLMGVGYLSEDQLPMIDRLIGLPQRQPDFRLADPSASDQPTDSEEGENAITNPNGSASMSTRQTNALNNMINRLNNTVANLPV